jgi:hypothetical protein
MASDLPSDGYAPFLPDAVAPREEWRPLTAAERAEVLGVGEVCGACDMFVVAAPGLARAMSEHLGDREDFDRLQKAVHDVAFVRALQDCVEELVPFCQRPEGIACQGAWVSPGGMKLVTHNMRVTPPRRIGLHVDDWDHRPLTERAGGRRRLCANLGLAPRYLIFLRTPLSTLVAAGKLPKEIPEEISPAVLVRAYLGKHLKQAAYRLRIDPGEAYIMNADDVIHDGASGVAHAPDVALHFLGYFGPAALPAERRERAAI